MNQQKLELIRLMRNDGIKTELISIGKQHRLVDRKIPKNLETLLSLEDCISIGLTMAKDTGVDRIAMRITTYDIRRSVSISGHYNEISDESNWRKYAGFTLYLDYHGWDSLRDAGNKENINIRLGAVVPIPRSGSVRKSDYNIIYNLTPLLT